SNPAAGTTQFPLAAPAGKDSNARMVAPPGAINQGAFDPAGWKYGPAFNPPADAKVWNPVKVKMMQGGKVTGGTLFSATDPATYCAMANAGYDFIWTEMQHDQHDWGAGSRMWRTCPTAKAVPGARVAYSDGTAIPSPFPACGGHARLPRPSRASAWPIPTNARFSTRWTPARWSSSSRRST